MLTKKETDLINDPYFSIKKIIEDIEEDYVEVVSFNTSHSWSIWKRNGLVLLGHKYPGQIYFHKQTECRSIRHAVKVIQEHDRFWISEMM